MKITNSYKDLEEWEEGDWYIRFWYEDFFIQTGVCASSGEQAIRYAKEKLASQNLEDCEEIEVILRGVYK